MPLQGTLRALPNRVIFWKPAIPFQMTREELKFAQIVEWVLNRVHEPEYRQLVVEAVMVLTILSKNACSLRLGPRVLDIDAIIKKANELFLFDQVCNSVQPKREFSFSVFLGVVWWRCLLLLRQDPRGNLQRRE